MIDQLRQKLANMVGEGHEPAAIVMTPRELMRLKREVSRDHVFAQHDEGSGYTFEGVPIYRCFEISGPTVLSRDVFELLRRQTRYFSLGPLRERFASQPVETDEKPLLF